MPALDVRIVRHGDPPPFAGMDRDKVIHLKPGELRIVGLEGGMASGAPSVAILALLPSGETVIVETSMALWVAAMAAFRGGFPDVFRGGVFDPDARR